MAKKKVFASLALVASGALLAGCSSSAEVSAIDPDSTLAIIEMIEMDMETGTLEDGTEQMASTGDQHKLLVVSKDGSTDVVDAKDNGLFLVDWHEDALFIADSDMRTWLQPGKETVTQKNSGNLDTIFATTSLGNGKLLWGSFDVDSDDVTYSLVNPQDAETTTSKAFVSSFAPCGDTVYGLSIDEDYGEEIPEPADLESMSEEELDDYFSSVTYDSRAELTLHTVVKDDKLNITSIGSHSAVMDTVTSLGFSLSCEGDEAVFLALQGELDGGVYNRTQDPSEPLDFNLKDYAVGSKEDGDYGVLTIERWNVKSGERTIVPVTDADGKPFMKVASLLVGSAMGTTSLHDGTLYWVDGLGRLVATDVQTGKSKALSDSLQTSSNMDELAQIFTSFHKDNVSLLVHSEFAPDKDRIVALEIPSGKVLTNVEVPNLGGLVEAYDMNDPDAWESITSMTSVVAFHANPDIGGTS